MQTTRTEPRIKKERVAVYVSLGLAFAAIAAMVPMMSTTAFAEEPVNPDCWGGLTTERATTEGDIGEHSSEQEEPRSGLPNIFNPDATPRTPIHPSELGEMIDNCPT